MAIALVFTHTLTNSPLARHPQGYTSSGCFLALHISHTPACPRAFRLRMARSFGRFSEAVPAVFTFLRWFFAYVGFCTCFVCGVFVVLGCLFLLGSCSCWGRWGFWLFYYGGCCCGFGLGCSGLGVGAAVATVGARLAICCPCSLSSGSFSFRLALSRAARGRGGVLVLPAGVRPAPCFYQALRALGFVRIRPRVWVCQVSGVAVSLPPLFAWLRV